MNDAVNADASKRAKDTEIKVGDQVQAMGDVPAGQAVFDEPPLRVGQGFDPYAGEPTILPKAANKDTCEPIRPPEVHDGNVVSPAGKYVFTCPVTPTLGDQCLRGCGRTFEAHIDSEGLVDCPWCGIWFHYYEPGVLQAADKASTAKHVYDVQSVPARDWQAVVTPEIRASSAISEHAQRCYYQNIVHTVCEALDVIDGKDIGQGTGIACGTVLSPSQAVEDRMWRLVREVSELRVSAECGRLACEISHT